MHIKGREPVASGGSKVTGCACTSVPGVCRVSRGCKYMCGSACMWRKHTNNATIIRVKEGRWRRNHRCSKERRAVMSVWREQDESADQMSAEGGCREMIESASHGNNKQTDHFQSDSGNLIF